MNDLATDQPTKPPAKGARGVLIVASLALALVVIAPVLLSSQDLFRWGESGLGLPAGWAWLVPVALDCAAVVCVAFCIVSAWRRERPGIFAVLVWVFAGVSAWVQYVHGMTPAVRATAPQAAYGFPALALLGPLLLEVVLGRVRRWARADAGQIMASGVSFGERWLPGVALRETLRAWAASKREGFNRPEDAIAYVRQVASMKNLADVDRLRYASQALATLDVYPLRAWTEARGYAVPQAAVDEFLATATANTIPRRQVAPRVDTPAITGPQPAAIAAAPVSPAPMRAGAASMDLTSPDYHRQNLAGMTKLEAAVYALGHLGTDARTGTVVTWLGEHGMSVTRGTVGTARERAGSALTGRSGEYRMVPRPNLVAVKS